jgi:hypothetical protein
MNGQLVPQAGRAPMGTIPPQLGHFRLDYRWHLQRRGLGPVRSVLEAFETVGLDVGRQVCTVSRCTPNFSATSMTRIPSLMTAKTAS